MKKGDLRKQEIMDTAEALFCRNGYEGTSIQDILDRMHSSKGSFYHHYVSKEALLEGICRRRAELICRDVSAGTDGRKSAAENLDLLLSGMIPFRNEKLRFLMMLLPIFRLPEGRMVRLGYCEALASCFRPAIIQELARGHSAGELFCNDPDNSADILLTLVNSLWVRICADLAESADKGKEADLPGLMRMVEKYRTAAEQTASLPYGSLVLISIPMLSTLSEQILTHWK